VSRPEDAIQRCVFAHIRARGVSGLVAIHVGNGGYRRPAEARIMSGLGVTPGVPDVLLWHDNKSFALEIKSENGRLSPHQTEMLARLDSAGVVTAVCHGLDASIKCLEAWQLLRGHCC
jgi:VRR-NUC domain